MIRVYPKYIIEFKIKNSKLRWKFHILAFLITINICKKGDFFIYDILLLNYKKIYAIGVTIIKLNTVLSNHITTKSLMRMGISVERILGTLAEKNIIVETEVTAIINLVINGASTTINEGKNISVIPIAAPFAVKKESGI